MKNYELYVRRYNRYSLMLATGASIGFCCLLLLARVVHTGSWRYVFLVWNLFLASIPYFIASRLHARQDGVSAPALALWLTAWLLFFPNAPYIITDLFHLVPREVPLWFDLLLLVSFAWNGLMLGFFSLIDAQEIVSRRFGEAKGWLFSAASIVLCSFGIYLGRYLRWNSWDVLSNPLLLLRDIAEPLLHPSAHLQTYGLTFSFSGFLFFSYYMLRQLTSMHSNRSGS
jgi:uncharacterized membrane protein